MRGQSLPLSVVAGALLVPITAVLAVVLIAPNEPTPSGAAAGEAVAVAASDPQAPAAPVVQGESLAADLAAACGPAGRELVAVVSAGAATDIQRAALEALRPICAAVGMSLPQDPATLATEVQPAATSAPAPLTVEAPAAPAEEDEWEAEFEDGEWEVEYEDGEWEVDD